jgi:hypothetical protein
MDVATFMIAENTNNPAAIPRAIQRLLFIKLPPNDKLLLVLIPC